MAFNFQGGSALAMGVTQGQPNMMASPLMPGGIMMPGMMPSFSQMPLMTPEQAQMVNPGLNDAPLEFNTNKNKPPMPISGDIDERGITSNGNQFNPDMEVNKEREGRRRDRDNRRPDRNGKDRQKDHKNDRRVSREVQDKTIDQEEGVNEEIGNDLSGGSVWTGMLPGVPYQMMSMPIMDPNMMMPQFGMMGGVPMGDQGMVPEVMVKEMIQLKSVTLVPPPPGTPLPTTRERPPGCKTIFVGGLAENTTEDIIREIFSRCGEMLTVRLSNKKFCHIRFMHEPSVDAALYFSGYRMRIENKTDLPNTGRLHVDFAQARDDQYEWECKQRQLQREARHRDRVEKERLRVPSPPPVPHYTEHEATTVSEKIKVEETFGKAVQVVITWLERGDCNKRNASVFYSMIQSTNSHIRRLLSEKANHEEELQKAKDLMKAQMQSLLMQYTQIERVFTAASHKKVWDHFTKAQRKNIEMWKKQSAEIKAVELEEHLISGGDDEMEVSDDEEPPTKKKHKGDERMNSIKEENDSLRCQLEAYKNEVDLVRSELKAELENTEAQLKVSQHTLQGMQKQLSEAKIAQSKEHAKVIQLEARLVQNGIEIDKEETSAGKATPPLVQQKLDEGEARLIGLISMFLHVHPFGASVDYIWSYLQKLEPGIKPSEVETLLAQFPSLFQQELSGIGANMERKWIITAFKPKETNI
ncbi:ecto-NOX disulfide-thiol exchanger 2 isoform X2 [Cimex lectularius]|uniref:RRM domain-containing protein n=1 Tax=Cimex lectularius TaxID=79782 RepID=A0A8I6S3C5_CIMLE|nr:ecto-NOX disulfide-thiol exchanger 2 isoform X2 [Cimex lectularius]